MRHAQLTLAVMVAALWAGVVAAKAAAPSTQPGPAAALAAFERVVQEDASLAAAQKSAAAAILARGKTDPDAAIEVIPEALAKLYPRYAEGLGAFSSARMDEAIKVFRELVRTKADSPVSRHLAAQAQLELARAYVVMERYEDAAAILGLLTSAPVPPAAPPGEALFLLGMCEARLLQNDKALAHLEQFIKDHPAAPERMQIAAHTLAADLRAWRDGTLTEAQVRMEDARRRLDLEDPGKQTREQQERVVAILDKLIEELERQQQQGGGGSAGGSQGKPGQQPGSASGPPAGNQTPSTPASDSSLPGGEGRIGALNRVNRGGAENWGNMKDREREAILNAAKGQIPDRYRELIEQYYKSLQPKERE